MVRLRLKRSSRLAGEQIEDLVQEVLLAIHNKRDTYRVDLPLLPWMHSITRYKLIDSIRAQGREPAFCEWNDELGQSVSDEAADSFVATSDLETLMASLPEKQREILRLAKLEEMPLQEIGTRMNMSLANVKVTVHRALASLRKSQADRDPIEDVSRE